MRPIPVIGYFKKPGFSGAVYFHIIAVCVTHLYVQINGQHANNIRMFQ